MRLECDEYPVFVVQLPSYVIERWKEAQDTTLAKLTIQGGETPIVSLQLQGEYARDLPKDFNGTVSVGDMRVFEEQDPSLHPQAPSIRSSPPNPHLITCAWSTGVSGPVLQMKTNVQLRKRNPETGEMELDKNVMRLAREKDAEEKRKIKAVSTKELSFKSGRDRMTLLPTMRMRKRKNQLYKHDKGKQDKRSRLDRSDVERMLFDLFETQERWKLSSLQKRTKQPTSWLKEVLSDIAVLHHSGPYNGQYELKPEFVKNKST